VENVGGRKREGGGRGKSGELVLSVYLK